VKYKGTDALGFVFRANLTRRHLTTSQRAMVAAGLANMKQGSGPYMVDEKGASAPFISQSDAAEMMNVSRESVKRTKRVLASGDEDLIDDVRAGEVSVTGAAKKVRPAPPRRSHRRWRWPKHCLANIQGQAISVALTTIASVATLPSSRFK
jgi:hypothetical protein